MVTFFHTVLLSKNLKFRTALVVCPLNTVLNWVYEFKKWQRNMGSDRVNVCSAAYTWLQGFRRTRGCTDMNLVWQVQHLVRAKHLSDRVRALQTWYREGGVMIVGYEMYRVLSLASKTTDEERRRQLKTILVDPGSITEDWHRLNQV